MRAPISKYRCLLPLAAIATTVSQVQAQSDQHSQAEEIVVTSNRIPIPQRQIGTSVSVVTEQDIEAHGNLALVDVLRQMPAIGSSNSGGAGKATTLRIRGEEGFRTLTIFDGLRLLDPSAPQIGPNMGQLLSSGIGRVEILRGPQGLSYGADAGGVVNISSRQADDGLQGQLDVQTGEFDTQQIAGDIGIAGDLGDAFLSVADYETDGFNTRQDDTALGDNDGYDNTTLHFRGGINLSDALRMDAVYRDVEGDAQYDGCGFPEVFDCLSIFEQQSYRVGFSYETADFSHSLSYSKVDTFRDSLVEGSSSFPATGELTRIEYVGTATNLPGFDLVFGADLEQDDYDDYNRDNQGFYVEYLSDFSENLFITAGIRYDDNDDFGDNTSYRLSAAYLLDTGSASTLKLRGSYGTGFRAPSPYEVFYNTGPNAFPPASLISLNQETSEGYELGLEYMQDTGLHLEAVYFQQDVEDAIEFDLATFSGYLQYPGTSTSEGIELIAELPVSNNLSFNANYTYNDTSAPDGSQRLRRPEHLLNVGASVYAIQKKLNFNIYLRASRNTIDISGPLPDFQVVDLSAYYNVTDAFQFYGRVENLLDEEYQEVINYNTAGSAAYFGFKLSFGNI